MWIVKPFMQKEQAGLEGRTIDVGATKVHVRNAIAEGGFSCVYLARDAVHTSRQYAVKHMICPDGESLELVMKEISVLKMLKGHPNVVALVAHAVFDMGRTKEALLVMEFCEKSLVAVLDNRGSGYFDENQILVIFRDVCNAVFAMHCQSPPIAHRDLKAENVLLGADGAWKLCDFGSTSTNHKCFAKPEEMGIEEDNIRKHTTPAYRAPEMWDLYRKEVISEKVDIWALGCLLYRICYFKSAFDGESKLQILNGNYRIPELPKYSASITSLIKDLLGASPDIRPDITQVWFRVNELLPLELQKHLPDGSGSGSAVGVSPSTSDVHDEGAPRRNSAKPRRSPPPSSRESDKEMQDSGPSHAPSKVGGAGAPVGGAFWSTQHAPQVIVEKSSVYDEEPVARLKSKHSYRSEARVSPPKEQNIRRSTQGNSKRYDEGSADDFEIRFFPATNTEHGPEKTKAPSESKATFQNEAFNSLVAEFDTSKLNIGKTTNMNSNTRSGNEELEAEIVRLKELLKHTNLEKAEITSKYEKLTAICRSQRQEIHELKQSLAATTPLPPSKDSSKNQVSPGSSQSPTPPREKIEGTVWELQQEMFASNPSTPSPSPEPQTWQAFVEEPKGQSAPRTSHSKSVRTISGQRRAAIPAAASAPNDAWGFGQESFTAAPGGAHITKSLDQGTGSQRYGGGQTKKVEMKQQPAGWAGF